MRRPKKRSNNLGMNNSELSARLRAPRGSGAPVMVAELSGNHNGSLQRALDLVKAAYDAGADAIKLQTYTADTITLNAPGPEFFVQSPGSPWHGRSLYSLYAEASTPWEWHRDIISYAEKLGMGWFSSPFDFSAVDFLEELQAPAYKIASPEIVDLPLIECCARTGKPLVISNGMACISEMESAVLAARNAGCVDLVLLKCTTDYPASPENSNIRTIPHMAEMFGCATGLSDHTLGIGVSVAAVALGAVLIEKHLTLSRAEGGPDAHFSLEPSEFALMVRECKSAWKSLGHIQYGPVDVEKNSLRGRRSLYVVEDIESGQMLTSENVRSIRPGFGMAPKHYPEVMGRRARVALKRGTPLSWELFE